MTTIFSGTECANALLATLSERVQKNGPPPKLGIIQVGENPASSSYIRQKEKAAKKSGVIFEHFKLARSSSLEEISEKIQTLNNDSSVSGFMLQLPLDTSENISAKDVENLLNSIDSKKDADGLHIVNQGRLFTGESTNRKLSSALPATALGIMRLLEANGVEVAGLDIVVVGRSRLVGLPIATLLTHAGATVTICHSKTKNLKEKTQKADLLVAAAGVKHLITSEHIKEGAIVIDVGIHLTDEKKITGDLHPNAREKCAAYSPVPGGVGPMTVAGLIENTIFLRYGHTSGTTCVT